jgi:hypothetical protein
MDASSPGFPEGAKVPRVVRAVFPIYRGVISSVAHLQVGGVVDLLLQFAGSLLGVSAFHAGRVIAKKNALCERKER